MDRSRRNLFLLGDVSDCRGLALALADNLRRAAKNVARHRPPSAGVRPRSTLWLSVQKSSNLLTLTRSDGYGHFLTLRKNYASGSTAWQGTYGSSLSLSDAMILSYLSGAGSISIISTPTPSPTPEPVP